LAPLRKRKVASAGTNVSEISIAPSNAKQTVKAMGVNKRRSTLSSMNNGR